MSTGKVAPGVSSTWKVIVRLPKKRCRVPPRRIKSVFCSRFTLYFLGLAFCVFTWGLQYKLSLYDPPKAVSHEMPQAKLLSKDQQSHVSESPLVKGMSVPDKTSQLAFFTLLFTLLLVSVVSVQPKQAARLADRNEPVRPPSLANLHSLFFRPPPILY